MPLALHKNKEDAVVAAIDAVDTAFVVAIIVWCCSMWTFIDLLCISSSLNAQRIHANWCTLANVLVCCYHCSSARAAVAP